MTDEPDLTKRQEQVLRALMAQKLAADIDPTEVGGLANDELAQQLGVSDEEIRHNIRALIDLGYIDLRPAESAMEDDWFRQVECDWRCPDGRYCNMTVHFYALAASPLRRPHRCRGVTGRLLLPGACKRHATPDAGRGPAAVRGDRRGRGVCLWALHRR